MIAPAQEAQADEPVVELNKHADFGKRHGESCQLEEQESRLASIKKRISPIVNRATMSQSKHASHMNVDELRTQTAQWHGHCKGTSLRARFLPQCHFAVTAATCECFQAARQDGAEQGELASLAAANRDLTAANEDLTRRCAQQAQMGGGRTE